jgi:signal transduction histidine kinase
MLRKPRDQTDDSLRVERDKTDTELEQREKVAASEADDVVRAARSRAVEVIEEARATADDRLEEKRSPSNADALAEDRATEDAALRAEYRTADAQTNHERAGRKRALEALVGHERADTDERLLVERNRADTALASRDDFLGMVTHDLRTLLASISLGAAVMVRHAGDDEAGARVRREADRIQRVTGRMNRLVGDLVDVVSIDAGKLHVSPRAEDPQRLVAEMEGAFHAAAAAKGLLFTTHIAPGVTLAQLDFDRVLQVLANLVSNAIKFTPSGGSLTVRVEPDGACPFVRFAVTDTGEGIAAEKLPAVFERFWQALGADRRGLGLGLYISRCIVEAHGGSIGAESTPGRGSTFHFTLPTAPPQADAA